MGIERSRRMAQSKRSKEIADLVIAYYLKKSGKVEPVICPYGHPDMVHDVLEQTSYGVSKQNADYGWGTRHRRGVDRINHALRQDKRFRECRVRGLRLMVGFDYLGENP